MQNLKKDLRKLYHVDIVKSQEDFREYLYKYKNYYDYIVYDRQMTPLSFFDIMRVEQEKAKHIAIDDDGAARELFDYRIDIIPGPRQTKSDYYNPMLLDLPENIRKQYSEEKSTLVFFSTKDDMMFKFKQFCKINKFGNDFIFVEEHIDNIKEEFHKYSNIITSFGISMFQAIYAGCHVHVFNRDLYHHKLTQYLGIHNLGYEYPVYPSSFDGYDYMQQSQLKEKIFGGFEKKTPAEVILEYINA